MTDRELLSRAKAASLNAYVPYSRFAVGAALECADGTVFTGCNVENAALGSTICAERTACCKAVSEAPGISPHRHLRRQRKLVYPLRRVPPVPGRVFPGHGGAVRQGRRPLCQLQALGAAAAHLQLLTRKKTKPPADADVRTPGASLRLFPAGAFVFFG